MPETPLAASVYRPRTLAEAFRIMKSGDGPRFYLAGGTDLIVKARDGMVPSSIWCDLTGLHELRGVRLHKGRIEIGSATVYMDLIESPMIRRHAPALADAMREIGGEQIKNRGTLGGNLANGSPAADSVPALFSLGATVHTRLGGRKRDIPVENFATGPGRTVLKPGELIVSLSFPARKAIRGKFLRLGQRRANAISKISVAASLTLKDGRVDWAGVALGAVGPTVIRARPTERVLVGRSLTTQTIDSAVNAVMEEAHPIDDVRSTAAYRRRMCGVLLRRILTSLAS